MKLKRRVIIEKYKEEIAEFYSGLGGARRGSETGEGRRRCAGRCAGCSCGCVVVGPGAGVAQAPGRPPGRYGLRCAGLRKAEAYAASTRMSVAEAVAIEEAGAATRRSCGEGAAGKLRPDALSAGGLCRLCGRRAAATGRTWMRSTSGPRRRWIASCRAASRAKAGDRAGHRRNLALELLRDAGEDYGFMARCSTTGW